MFLRLPLAWMKDKGWRIFWLRMKDERWKTYYLRLCVSESRHISLSSCVLNLLSKSALYLSVKRSFILWGVNFNKAEVISMHLCFHSKTAAKIPLFSETAKQNLHFANSHLAKCRNCTVSQQFGKGGLLFDNLFYLPFLTIPYQFTNSRITISPLIPINYSLIIPWYSPLKTM